MLIASTLHSGWEKMYLSAHANLALFAFLFMICALEVVLLKMTTSSLPPLNSNNTNGNFDDFDDGNDHEIYFENLENNYEQWARRQMRYRQQQQQQQQAMLAQQQQEQQT